MKIKIFVLLIVGVLMLFTGCQQENAFSPQAIQNDQMPADLTLAKKPAANLRGTMDLFFYPDNPVWRGTITFEEYGVYGMRFFHLSPFKEYSQASPFEEYFEIYDLTNTSYVYLGGPDAGVTTLANKPPDPCKYRMNGEIAETKPPFEEWLGRHVHMSGEITWQFLPGVEEPVPATAPGIFRIN